MQGTIALNDYRHFSMSIFNILYILPCTFIFKGMKNLYEKYKKKKDDIRTEYEQIKKNVSEHMEYNTLETYSCSFKNSQLYFVFNEEYIFEGAFVIRSDDIFKSLNSLVTIGNITPSKIPSKVIIYKN